MHVWRIPKVSIFMAVTIKIVPEKAQKWPKMARFWPKWRYNGRVMAWEVFLYQCLWVTKFCAKFGCSRTPRTASVPNSFIVLRCMWKEPAPLAVFGPKSLIFMWLSKSFGTNITENHFGNLSALFFGQALDQMGQNADIWPKMPVLGQIWPFLGPKSNFLGAGSKNFGTLISGF